MMDKIRVRKVERWINGAVCPHLGHEVPRQEGIKDRNDELGGGLYDLRYREEQDRKYDAALLVSLPRGEGVSLR
jgi:hypothetical protein